MDVDRQLLAERELDDRLLLPAPEEGEDANAESRPQETLRATSRAGFCSSLARKWSLNLA